MEHFDINNYKDWQIDSDFDSDNEEKKFNPAELPKVDTTGKAEKDLQMKKADIQYKVFKNSDVSGYGYDIILDGHTYVHQPTIPAVSGNRGFETEEKAKSVAKLVANKIHNNILPPTVDVKELDSLGVK